jgi:polysaccharide deacetylase 2 family uncharacterized protein YibQ
MGEETDDLSTPLGRQAPRAPRRRLPVLPLLTGLFGVSLAVFAGFVLFGDDRGGGEPVVAVAIHEAGLPDPAVTDAAAATKVETTKVATTAAATAATGAEPAGQRTVTIIDGSSGTRKSVTIPAADPDVVTPEVAQGLARGTAAPVAPAAAPGIDPRLQETSRHGLIPITAGGAAPVRAYAATGPRGAATGRPSVVVVVSGLGISTAQTLEAIRRLPAAVTLGFTPYGPQARKLTAEARAAGHEILLQVPMEPFDYPDNDPGPQTLLVSSSAPQNLDRLHWHMSRFAGYVGLSPFMGARLAADDAAMQTVITDAARRGLGYFDDGRAARSVAARLAETGGLPFARADLVIDKVAAAVDIDAALASLERLARERGTAIGSATLAPVTIERIAAWTAALADRGITLVPLTTAMLKSKSS